MTVLVVVLGGLATVDILAYLLMRHWGKDDE